MSAVILADRDSLYAWFVTEALRTVGVPVTWFRSATAAVAAAAAGEGDQLLLMDAGTWLAEPAAAVPPLAPAVLLGWASDRRPPAGFSVEREKPGDAAALRRLVATATGGWAASLVPAASRDGAGSRAPGG
jgi:hypothetical protein